MKDKILKSKKDKIKEKIQEYEFKLDMLNRTIPDDFIRFYKQDGIESEHSFIGTKKFLIKHLKELNESYNLKLF